MKTSVKSGKYVVAVSGGVDSVALLDLLDKQPGLELVVAHFDHGTRPDSADDRRLVRRLSEKYELPFKYAEGKLGPDSSEAAARQARYAFLESVRRRAGAAAIITAHHQDDVLETGIINLLRGTGRKGLSSLRSRKDIIRPLLGFNKAEIIDYAKGHGLEWHEDSTNQDTGYLRNYVRHVLVPKLTWQDKADLQLIFEALAETNDKLDQQLSEFITRADTDRMNRQWFTMLPHDISKEVMATWLRGHELRGFDRPMLERLVTQAKTGRNGRQFPIMAGRHLAVGSEQLTLV